MAEPRTLPNVVYTAGLNDLSGRLFRHGEHIDYPSLRNQFLPELDKLGEALVISPRVVLKVDGRSLILPILLDYFKDAETVLALMREAALEFVVWTHGIGSLGSVVLGMPSPIESERDAGTLAERDLRIAFPNLDAGLKRELIEAFVSRTTATDGRSAEEAVNVAMSLADKGAFGDRIPDRHAFINSESQAVTDAARKTAEDLFETFVVLGNEYDVFETDGTWEAITRVAADIHRSENVLDAVESVYFEASVPSTRTLLNRGVIAPADVLRVRHHPATAAFRRWLWRADDPNDGPALAADYLQALDRALDPHDGAWYRKARIVIASIFGEGASRLASVGGAVIGAKLGGVPGALVGAAVGPAASGAVSLLEPMVPELFRKPDPRQFTDHVLRPLSKRQPQPAE